MTVKNNDQTAASNWKQNKRKEVEEDERAMIEAEMGKLMTSQVDRFILRSCQTIMKVIQTHVPPFNLLLPVRMKTDHKFLLTLLVMMTALLQLLHRHLFLRIIQNLFSVLF